MASKLRRAPLFPYEGSVFYPNGIPQGSNSGKHTSATNQLKKMEVGVGYTNGTTPVAGILADVRTERSPAKTGLHVNFKEKGEIKEKREKFLTAKYGHHQMSLIRKRLAVEMWLYEELKKLYNNSQQVDSVNNDEVEVDIDELLDMDTDEDRRRHLHNLLINAKGSQNDVKKFINDLLEKATTL